MLARPDWARPKLAPVGDRFAAVRRHGGADNVWIGSSNAPLRLATDVGPWRLRDFHWGLDGSGLVLELDRGAAGQRWLDWLDLATGATTRLSPEDVTDARYAGQSGAGRPRILMAVWHQAGDGSELMSMTPTGAVVGHWQGPGPPASRWLATDTQAIAVCPDGDTVTWWHTRLPEPSWSPVATMSAQDAIGSRPVAFSSDGGRLVVKSSAGRDTVALVEMSAPAWAPRVVSADNRYDVRSVLMAPDGSGPDLVRTTDPDSPQTALTSEAAADLEQLRRLADGCWARIVGRNKTHFLAEIDYPVGGPAYVLSARTAADVSRPLVRYTGLDGVRIHRRESFCYVARDGWPVRGFLTRPEGEPPWPAVLVIHEGPWSMDEAEMDPWAQFLASAGLCCIQVNYRGSRGFGRKFREAGDRQWSLAMQDDLVDALRSAAVVAVAQPGRIAAMGHGYGGYAALMLTTQTEVGIMCAVSASAPTDLVRYVGSLLSLGSAEAADYAARIGQPFEDRARLSAASPMSRIADFTVPLLLFHGRQDAVVPVSHAVMFAESLQAAGKLPGLVLYEGEAHRYTRPQNVSDFQARSIGFLLENLTCRVGSGTRQPGSAV